MKYILICPSSRPAIEHLTSLTPPAAMPLLGESLVEYWMSHLALVKATEVWILADDRPAQIAALVGDGSRWGVPTKVIPESRELTAAQAEIKYARELLSDPHEIVVADHFPETMQPLLTSYADLFAGLIEWMPRAVTPDRVGVHELQPGVWVGLHSRISPGARIHAPCWIGQHVYIGADAVVGPMTIIEDRSFVEPKAQVTSSMIGPDTFVGHLAAIQDSFAWGNLIVNWKSNLFTQITDAFLLCALRRPSIGSAADSILARLAQVYSRNKDDLQMLWKHFLLDKEDKLSTHDKL